MEFAVNMPEQEPQVGHAERSAPSEIGHLRSWGRCFSAHSCG